MNNNSTPPSSSLNSATVTTVTQSPLSAARSSIGFKGYLLDHVSRCYYLGNGYRLYDPRMRAFYSPDSLSPFGVAGINRYQYCNLDPVNFKDPSGHLPILIVALIATAISAALSASALGVNLAAWHYRKSDKAYAETLDSVALGLDVAAVLFGLVGIGGALKAPRALQVAHRASRAGVSAYYTTRRGVVTFRAGARAFTQNSRISGPGAKAINQNYQNGLSALLNGLFARTPGVSPLFKAGAIVTGVSSTAAGVNLIRKYGPFAN